jgi:cytochrome P450
VYRKRLKSASSNRGTDTVPGLRFIDITQPKWLEHVQSLNFENYIKGDLVKEGAGDVLGEGIFVTDGESWRRQRKVIFF